MKIFIALIKSITLLQILFVFNIHSQVVTVGGIMFPSGSNASQAIIDELAIGGPSSDWKDIPFPRTGVANCPGISSTPTTINQEIDTYGKTILIVISPSDCPYCRIAADAANADIMSRISNIRLWYVGSKLAGGTSDCGEITYMKSQYPFVNAAHHFQMDNWWWDNAIGRGHHNTSNSCYWAMPAMPSVYRIVDPISRKVTDLGYYLPVAALDAAIANNFNPVAGIDISPSTLNVSVTGGNLNFSISGIGSWSILNNAGWLSLSTLSGAGSKTVVVTANNNPNINSRNYVITISGSSNKFLTISQAGAAANLSVSPTMINFTSASNSQIVNLTSNISWVANSSMAWITLSSTTGTGSATPTLFAANNPTINTRTGSVTFSGGSLNRIINITQSGVAQMLTVSASNLTFSSTGHSLNVSVTSNISWTTSSSDTWLTLNTSNGTGNGIVSLSVATNVSTSIRNASATISGGSFVRIINVSQSGATPVLNLSTSNLSYASTSSASILTVTGNIAWTVSGVPVWLTLNTFSGFGNTILSLNASANGVTARAATLSFSGLGNLKHVNVTQNAASAVLTVNPPNMNVSAAASNQNIEILTNTVWVISTSGAWLTLSTVNGSGNGNVTVAISSNISTSPRNAIVLVSVSGSEKLISINQDGATPILSVNPTAVLSPSSGNVYSLSLTGNSNWVATPSHTWITINQISGSGNSIIEVTIAPNTSIVPKVGKISFTYGSSLLEIPVTVSGATPILNVSINNLNYVAEGSVQSVTVSSNVAWSLSTNESWLSLSPSNGTNDGVFDISTSANSIPSSRSTIVTILGGTISKTITITQNAAAEFITPSPGNLSYNSAGGSQNLDISSNTNWQIKSSQSWITSSITSSGSNTTLAITLTENLSTSTRYGNITILGVGGARSVVNIDQLGASPALIISSSQLVVSTTGTTGTVSITSNISWDASENESWLEISNPSGNQNGVLNINVSTNTTSSARESRITITGSSLIRILTIIQSAGTEVLQISNQNISATSSDTFGTLSITSNLLWNIANTTNWIVFNSTTGNQNSTISYTILGNNSALPRTATINISGGISSKSIVINQSGAAEMLSFSDELITYDKNSNSTIFDILSNTSWTITGIPNWLSVDPTMGSNNENVIITPTANTSKTSRSAEIEIIGYKGTIDKLNITQSGENSTSVFAKSAEIKLVVSPNPVQKGDIVYLSEEIEFKLFDSTGKCVLASQTSKTINTLGLNIGLYIVQSPKFSPVKIIIQ